MEHGKQGLEQHTGEQKRIAASFRDPSGFVFMKDGTLYRRVNEAYARSYDTLMTSGLYDELVRREYLVPHEEVSAPQGAYKLLKPERIPFISYPYEWCFSELKDAALLTLKIQKLALKFGMTLKDASAYNIQFRKGKPILIDTLSFESCAEGAPWVAYKQFCEHFLAPLALMAFTEVRLGQMLRVSVNGIPLDLASKLLPWRSWFRAISFFHIHMHAKSQRRHAESTVQLRGNSFTRPAMDELLENLSSGVRSLRWRPADTEWGEYYGNTNYSVQAADEKGRAISRFIALAKPKSVWDLGANDGTYSRMASDAGIATVAFDIDPAAVEHGYLTVKEKKEERILPLVLDLTNPSPGLGWANAERMSLAERGPADMALALALVHHLAITNNVPFGMMAEFFAGICRTLVMEFVPKGDLQVERLLRNRADIFPGYTQEKFEEAFRERFTVREVYAIPGTKRTLYYLERK
jgi:ribosomal protein L11 methylase PrmA